MPPTLSELPTLPTHLRGDGPCQDCGGGNVVWHTLNVFWNEVCRDERTGAERPSIVCVPCFVKRVEGAGCGCGEGGGDGA